MATTIEYMLMAGASYFDTRFDINRTPRPQGWERLDVETGLDHRGGKSGFEATAYIKGDEIVIAYAGTYSKDPSDIISDLALAVGYADAQLYKAARYYFDIKKAHPNATITFTGHSLGGGLAALMSTFFGESAETFDQAPFLLAASFDNAASLLLANSGATIDISRNDIGTPFNDVEVVILTALNGQIHRAEWSSSRNRFVGGAVAPSSHSSFTSLLRDNYNASRIQNISAAGEFLSLYPSSALRLGESGPPIQHGAQNSPLFDLANTADALHDLSLLTAIYYSENFRQATNEISFLERDIFDPNLFYRETDSTEQNFLTNLIRYEFGIPGEANTQLGLLTKFSSDVRKLTFSTDLSIEESLLKILLNAYYVNEKPQTIAPAELISLDARGFRFDLSQFSDAPSFTGYQKMVGWISAQTTNDVAIQKQIKQFLASSSRMTLPFSYAYLNNSANSDSDNTRDFILASGYLYGGGGNDLLIGWYGEKDDSFGADYLSGGAGNDLYIFDRGYGEDTIASSTVDTRASEVDTLLFAASILPKNISMSIEDRDLILSISGTKDKIIIEDFLSSAGHFNTLQKILFSDETSWQVNELNTFFSNANHFIRGDDTNDSLNGLSRNDTIYGYGGDDTLIGGAGNDSLIGGSGNDSSMGGTGSDTYIFNKGDGSDTIDNYDYSSNKTDTLKFIDIKSTGVTTSRDVKNKNNLILKVTGKTDQITLKNYFYSVDYKIDQFTFSDDIRINNFLIGDGKANKLSGTIKNDYIDGSTGADTLTGGLGDDFYVVDNAKDKITENLNEGIDTVQSIINYILGDNIENLTLTGTGIINGSGNALNNILTGNSASNTLSGGAGADTLIGGAGNDIYIIDNANDKIIENLNEGTDSIQSSVIYTLSDNLENLTLTGAAAINATGNELNNILIGNSANNTLNGGLGVDTLIGGAGNDTYLFNPANAKDTIVDASGNDALVFGSGINANQLWFQHTGNNLTITKIGTADSVTIKDWYLQTATKNMHLETFKSGDNKILLDSAVENLVQAMASFSPPKSGQTNLPSNYQTTLNSVIAGNWK